MRKNLKSIFILTGIILFFALLTIGSILSNRMPQNTPDLVGNTGGNLNNSGLFCEQDGRVYFANAFDNGCMYSMDVNEANFKKLTDTAVSSINAGGKYLYYYMDNSSGGAGLGYVIRTYGIYRCKLNGSASKCLKRQSAIVITLVGNSLYYQNYDTTNYTQLYKMSTSKSKDKDDVLLADYIINPASCYNQTIYFNGTQKDHYLYTLDTTTDTISTLWEGNVWNPTYYENYIYFMDISNNYRLCRYSLADQTVEVLTEERLDTFNVGNGYVYYQVSSATEPALKRMLPDGSNQETVAEGVYNSINMTSGYVYFKEYSVDNILYHTPVAGPVNVSIFSSAQAAVE